MRAREVLIGGSLALVVAASALSAACADEPGGAPPAVQPEAGTSDADAASPGSPLCVDGKPAVEWPPGPHEVALTSVLPPDLAWDGPEGTIALKGYFEPCAPRSRLLVIRVSAAWCGTCVWHASHTKRVLEDPRFADRVVLLDLVLADEDNMPPTIATAAKWRTRIDAPGKVAIDAKYTFSAALGSREVLPLYVFVDTRTMKLVTLATDPSPDQFADKMLVELAELDKKPRPAPIVPVLYDDILPEQHWDMVRDMKLVAAPPPDPTNEYGDVPAAAALGKQLFADPLLSPSGTVSCATCHDAAKAFGDGLAQSVGIATVDRNSPSVAFASHARWQFWDGRADTLWMQALGPPENAKEVGSSRLFIAHQIEARYAAEYDAVFGAKYPRPDLTGLPAAGKPGDAAYDALPQPKRDEITRLYVNVGKAIAAFERSIRVKPNALDRYADGDKSALTPPQKQGLFAFMKLGCAQCHWGPRLTDDAFHALRFPSGKQDGTADRGRIDVLPTLASGEFVASSKWSDAPSAAKPLMLELAPSMLGAFKTPALRGVAQSAPYGHGGKLATLLAVSRHYGQRAQLVPAAEATGTVEPWAPEFDAVVQGEVPAMLELLTADVAP
jgi:cytochrome c peroxidase